MIANWLTRAERLRMEAAIVALFEPYEFIVCSEDVLLRIIVMPDALEMLWGADVGPQDAEGLVDANREAILTTAFDKLASGRIQDDGSIIVNEFDLDEGPD